MKISAVISTWNKQDAILDAALRLTDGVGHEPVLYHVVLAHAERFHQPVQAVAKGDEILAQAIEFALQQRQFPAQ